MSFGSEKLSRLTPFSSTRARVWSPYHPVNALLPGGTDTATGRVFANTPEALAFVEGLHALKRMHRLMRSLRQGFI